MQTAMTSMMGGTIGDKRWQWLFFIVAGTSLAMGCSSAEDKHEEQTTPATKLPEVTDAKPPQKPVAKIEPVQIVHKQAPTPVPRTIEGTLESAPLAAVEAGSAETLFELLPAERTGIDFVYQWNPPPHRAPEIRNAAHGGGVCTGDFDGDGLPDVLLTRPSGGHRLYRNLGGFRFEDVTDKAGVRDDTIWGQGAAMVDIDNDGNLDLFVCGFDCPNRLYINQGDGTFLEKAESYGLAASRASVMMAFADYDNDGDLDAYLLTNRVAPAGKVEGEYHVAADKTVTVVEEDKEMFDVIEFKPKVYRFVTAGQFDLLYRNNGDGTFSEVGREAGIAGNEYGLSATWWDYDNDGFQDLYVANDFFGADHLYRNNQDGTFTDVAPTAIPHTPWYSMGADCGDINNDGRVDFISTDMSATSHYRQKVTMGDMGDSAWFLGFPQPRQYMRNAVYINSGAERFLEAGYLTGLDSTDWTWAVRVADLDCDGWQDVYFTNGMTRDYFNSDLKRQSLALGSDQTPEVQEFWDNQQKLVERNLAFRNLGDLQFENIGQAWGLDQRSASYGAALADLDGDGDLDLVVNNFEEAPGIYRNNAVGQHRAVVKLRGVESNRFGLGAQVELEIAGGRQVRQLSSSHGFMSADEPMIHFGLAKNDQIDKLIVRWPSGRTQTFSDLAVDQQFTITEPGEPTPSLTPVPIASWYQPSEVGPVFEQSETEYDDFVRQPLLPWKHSQLGPGQAWGDIDNDGDADLFVGAAKGFVSGLFRNDGDGKFTSIDSWPWEDDTTYEVMGSLFFDADGDGDQDLYLVSGGVECEPDDPSLQDRLFLNDGQGAFTAAPAGALPALRNSGSVVAASDFDRDGDLDLFVGGRIIPGSYPVAAQSHLLQNDDGVFIDATTQLAPELQHTGLVTGAVWSDADSDGWLDLLVTHEWGPIKLFHNENGKFVEKTPDAGLSELNGWWNGITGRDLDGDGDIDYVVTNFGLNTKYHATLDKPALVYYGRFGDSDVMQLIEAEFENDVLFPGRGKSCSTNAMPHLAEKFKTFDAFAKATLQEIYTPTKLDESQRFVASILESGVLINDGQGQFAFRPFPRLAQIAPAFGCAIVDANGDGQLDLVLAQNFYSPQPETGHMDGGTSLLLLGNGDCTFQAVGPVQSGLLVSGDAKSLTISDLNGDGKPDLLVGVNSGKVAAFESLPPPNARTVRVRLAGPVANATGVGARVTAKFPNGISQTAEVYAGDGYLSQSEPTIYFTAPSESNIEAIVVRWPDGEVTQEKPPADADEVVVRRTP